MLNEIIHLITEYDKVYDEDGFEIGSQKHVVECFADIKSTTYKEYYEASRNDEQVTDIFVVDERDYQLSMYVDPAGKKIRPSLVEYDKQLYKIVRRYRNNQKGNYTIELTCSEVE